MKERIKEILDNIKQGKLTRDIDEKYNNGFWDLAGNLSENDTEQEQLYNLFWAIVEECNIMKTFNYIYNGKIIDIGKYEHKDYALIQIGEVAQNLGLNPLDIEVKELEKC